MQIYIIINMQNYCIICKLVLYIIIDYLQWTVDIYSYLRLMTILLNKNRALTMIILFIEYATFMQLSRNL